MFLFNIVLSECLLGRISRVTVWYLHCIASCDSVIRPLYDRHEAEGNFMGSIEARIKTHEKSIEGMCNKHYR